MNAYAGEEEAEPEAGVEDLLEMFDIGEDVDTGVVNEGDDNDVVEEAGRVVEPRAGTVSYTHLTLPTILLV